MHVIRVLIHYVITLALASAGLLLLFIGVSMLSSTYQPGVGDNPLQLWHQTAMGMPLLLIAGGLLLLGFGHLLSLIWKKAQVPKAVNATGDQPWDRCEPSI
jgi:hypothetical protein